MEKDAQARCVLQLAPVDLSEFCRKGELVHERLDAIGLEVECVETEPVFPPIEVEVLIADSHPLGRSSHVGIEVGERDRPSRDGEMITDFEVDGGEGTAESGPMVGGAAEVPKTHLIEPDGAIERGRGVANAGARVEILRGRLFCRSSRLDKKNFMPLRGELQGKRDPRRARADDADIGAQCGAGVECVGLD